MQMSISKLKELKQFKKDFNVGHTLFNEGEPSYDLYILVSGEVTVKKNMVKITVIDRPGSYIGEMSALLHEPRDATCVCTRHSELICIPSHSLETFFDLSPYFGYKLASCLAERLKAMNRKYTGSD